MQNEREAEVLTVVRRILSSVVAINGPDASDDALLHDLCGGVSVEIPDVTGTEVHLAVCKIAAER